MRPVIDTVRIDKVTDENFEAIRSVLCGNVSLDNMSVRILTGTTTNSPDTQSKVLHSMGIKPVGWFPLIGDVYVQEITESFIDVRSTKPSVNFKLLLLFGNSITTEALVAEGSEGYLNTTEVIQNTPTTVIEEVVDLELKITPVVVRNSANEIPHSGTTIGTAYNSLAVSEDYFYLTTSAGYTDRITRINRDTGVADTLQVRAGATLTALTIASDGYLWVTESAVTGGNLYTHKIDLTTFTVDTTLTNATSQTSNIYDIYVDASYVYVSGSNGLGTTSRVVKIDKAGVAANTVLDLKVSGSSNIAHKILYISGYLYVVIDDAAATSAEIVKVDEATFTVDTTYTSTEAFEARTAVALNGIIYAPVQYNANHATAGGNITYRYGFTIFNTSTGAFSFVPIANGHNLHLLNTCLESDDYIYFISVNTSFNGATIIRYDTIEDVVANVWVPLYITSSGATHAINSLAVIDTDGEFTLIRNVNATNPANFEYVKIDWTEVD